MGGHDEADQLRRCGPVQYLLGQRAGGRGESLSANCGGGEEAFQRQAAEHAQDGLPSFRQWRCDGRAAMRRKRPPSGSRFVVVAVLLLLLLLLRHDYYDYYY